MLTTTKDASGYETLTSEEICGKGKRFVVEASDDYVIGGREWHVRIIELQGDVRDVKKCVKAAGRDAAIAVAEQVVTKMRAQAAA